MIIGMDCDIYWIGVNWFWFLVDLDYLFWFVFCQLQCGGVILVVDGDFMVQCDVVDDGIFWQWLVVVGYLCQEIVDILDLYVVVFVVVDFVWFVWDQFELFVVVVWFDQLLGIVDQVC